MNVSVSAAPSSRAVSFQRSQLNANETRVDYVLNEVGEYASRAGQRADLDDAPLLGRQSN